MEKKRREQITEFRTGIEGLVMTQFFYQMVLRRPLEMNQNEKGLISHRG